jgi:hypothetical protein
MWAEPSSRVSDFEMHFTRRRPLFAENSFELSGLARHGIMHREAVHESLEATSDEKSSERASLNTRTNRVITVRNS